MLRSVTTRLAGLAILIAGVWGGLIPFVGPYFHFTLGPDHTWTWTSARLYLDVLPAAAAVLGGLILLGWGPRIAGRIGSLLALAGGIWFAVGPDVSRLWHSGGAQGLAHGAGGRRTLEYLTFHSGLGVLIVMLAAFALPGVLALRRPVAAAGAPAVPVRRRRFGFIGGRRRAVATAGESPLARREVSRPRDGVASSSEGEVGAREAEPVGAPESR
jgi:hypothetical protein